MLNVTSVPLSELSQDPANARVHGADNLAAIVGSLRAFGQVEPLVVTQDGQIIGGNGRYEAMMALGWQKADVVRVDLDPVNARALGLALNRSADLAQWDNARLERLINELHADSFALDEIGFSEAEVARMLQDADTDGQGSGAAAEEVAEDETPEPPADPITQPGDVWILGRHTLRCADARACRPPSNLDVVFTDPPYGVSYVSRVDDSNGKNWGAIANDALNDDALVEMLRATVPDAPYRFICCDWHCYSVFERAFGKPKSVCVWDKGHFGMGRGYRRQHEFVLFYGTLNRTDLSDVWPFPRAPDYQHPTQKPVPLVAKALGDVARAGAVVYDPFGGSGTTLIAAEQMGMVAHLVEVAPKYCDVAVQRWEALTGQKAERQPAAAA